MRKLGFVLLLFFWPIRATTAKGPTLKEVRQGYVGTQVVVGGRASQYGLVHWTRVRAEEQPGGRFEPWPYSQLLPLSYKGKIGTIIAIQLHEEAGALNALGEAVAEDNMVDPLCDVVVRFDDGRLAMATQQASQLDSWKDFPAGASFIPPSERERQSQIVAKGLRSVIGRKVYATAFSTVYTVDTTRKEMFEGFDTRKLTDFPLLVPLTISEAKYLPDENAIVLKLELPDNREGLTCSTYSERVDKGNDSFLAHIAGDLLLAIPSGLTTHEREAIEKRTYFQRHV